MQSIPVRHSAGSYNVLISPGLAAEAGALIRAVVPGQRLAVITDETLEQRFDGWGLKLDPAVTVTVPAGEVAKSRAEWGRVTDALLAAGIGRDSAIVAIGGGSVGDLAGFVASTYMRGVPVVQVPTTLLAMVDASVGGKVGVDTAVGKNLVGAFHPPAVVLIDPDLLTALPDRFYREGLAEAVKHGVVADAAYFEWIVANAEALERRRGAEVTELVRRSVEIKAGVVARDERESGERAILNAGHTIGHALELLSGFQLRHGEAVAIGLVEECIIGESLGVTATGTAAKVAAALTLLGLPTKTAVPSPQSDLLRAMHTDKKNRAGAIRMALPARIGTMARDGALWTVAVEDRRVGA